MPFVRIDVLRAGQPKLDGLGRAVHEALIDAIGIPADDLFQVLTSHDGTTGTFRYDPDYLGVHRDDGIVLSISPCGRAGPTSRSRPCTPRSRSWPACTRTLSRGTCSSPSTRTSSRTGRSVTASRSTWSAASEGRLSVRREPVMEVTRKVGNATKGPADRFTGDVWMWPRIGATEHTEVRVVLFTPGARSAWHRHPAGQVLHVTEGAGLVQSRDGARAEVRAGDTVTTAPGEWHWHGAAPGTFMVHLAVTDGTAEWAGPVTDDDYQG